VTPDEFDAWPKCAVPACANKCCRSLQSRYCWPHTPGDAATARRALEEAAKDAAADRRTPARV